MGEIRLRRIHVSENLTAWRCDTQPCHVFLGKGGQRTRRGTLGIAVWRVAQNDVVCTQLRSEFRMDPVSNLDLLAGSLQQLAHLATTISVPRIHYARTRTRAQLRTHGLASADCRTHSPASFNEAAARQPQMLGRRTSGGNANRDVN